MAWRRRKERRELGQGGKKCRSRQAINYYNIIQKNVSLNVDTSLFSLPLSSLSAYLALERAGYIGEKKSVTREEGAQ